MVKPIKISLPHILYFATFYSLILLFGGIAYNWVFLYYYFDISIGDFFELTDYVSSDIVILLTASTLPIISTLVAFLYMEHPFSEKKYHYGMLALLALFLLFVAKEGYESGELKNFVFVPCIVIMTLFFIYFNNIENKLYTFCLLFHAVITLSYVIFAAIDNAKKVKDSSYISPYCIVFEDKYKSFSDHVFVKSNSNYAFLLDEKGKMVVIEKTKIKAFLPNIVARQT